MPSQRFSNKLVSSEGSASSKHAPDILGLIIELHLPNTYAIFYPRFPKGLNFEPLPPPEGSNG